MYTCFLSSEEIIIIPSEKESVLPEEETPESITEQEIPVLDFSENIYKEIQVTNSLLFRIYVFALFLLGLQIFKFFYRLVKHNVTDLF